VLKVGLFPCIGAIVVNPQPDVFLLSVAHLLCLKTMRMPQFDVTFVSQRLFYAYICLSNPPYSINPSLWLSSSTFFPSLQQCIALIGNYATNHAPRFCSFRLWHFINHLLTYLLTYICATCRNYASRFFSLLYLVLPRSSWNTDGGIHPVKGGLLQCSTGGSSETLHSVNRLAGCPWKNLLGMLQQVFTGWMPLLSSNQ